MSKNVLAVGAHPDDVEIGCGGTLAKHVARGDFVVILIMTNPHCIDYHGKIVRDKEVCEIEAQEAANVLGAKLISLGFKDKEVPYSVESIEAINKIIDDYEIDLIYTHWSHDTHQDHLRTTRAVLAAGRYVKTILMYEPFYPAGRSYVGFRNQYYVDISETISKKMAALKKHKTQIEKYGKEFLEAIKARARQRGYEIGSKYAECFEVVRILSDL